MTLSTSEKLAFGRAMDAAKAAGWSVNVADYAGPVVTVAGEAGALAIGSFPGWDHSDQDRLAWRDEREARAYLVAYWLDEVTGRGQLRRFEVRYLAARGWDKQGRAI